MLPLIKLKNRISYVLCASVCVCLPNFLNDMFRSKMLFILKTAWIRWFVVRSDFLFWMGGRICERNYSLYGLYNLIWLQPYLHSYKFCTANTCVFIKTFFCIMQIYIFILKLPLKIIFRIEKYSYCVRIFLDWHIVRNIWIVQHSKQ